MSKLEFLFFERENLLKELQTAIKNNLFLYKLALKNMIKKIDVIILQTKGINNSSNDLDHKINLIISEQNKKYEYKESRYK